MQTEVVEFLNTFYLNKGCVLEHETLYESEHGYEINIMRVSSRLRKRVGNITGGNTDVILNILPIAEGKGSVYPPDELLKIYYSPKVRKLEKDLLEIAGTTSVFQEWLRQGWIIRKVDYESDGKTVKQSVYGMGYSLYMVVESKRQQEDERLEARCVEWKSRFNEVLITAKRDNSQIPTRSVAISDNRVYLWSYIKQLCQSIEQNTEFQKIWALVHDQGLSWRLDKQESYMDFIVALAEIALVEIQFDWKEVGARYFREIGGSKRFDAYKDSFLEVLEQNVGCPLQLIGLSSLGTITPVYFAGALSGECGLRYPTGYVHATTDLTIYQTVFMTTCRHLWLVENRAVLTRMVAEGGFLMNVNSLVIGLDGQLRGGHRKLIADVLAHSDHIEQVLVWCDTDRAGFIISEHVEALLHEAGYAGSKWILPNNEMTQSIPHDRNDIYTWDEYKVEMARRLQHESSSEQEEWMGGAEVWTRWLSV